MIRNHILRIYLDSPLYLKFIQFQAEHKLGKAYAGLLIFIEGMKSLKLIDGETYDFYKHKYNKPLQVSPIEIQPLKPKLKCFICGKKAIGFSIFVESGKKYPLCGSHVQALKNNPKWKTEL